MKNNQLLKKCVVAFTLGCLSSMVFSNPLVITNNTSHDSTCRIIKAKSRKCTDGLPNGIGITRKGERNHKIEEASIKIACHPNEENCQALVYMMHSVATRRLQQYYLVLKAAYCLLHLYPAAVTPSMHRYMDFMLK